MSEVVPKRVREMVYDRRERQRRKWGDLHDDMHGDEGFEALILEYAMRHEWIDVAALGIAAQESRIRRDIFGAGEVKS